MIFGCTIAVTNLFSQVDFVVNDVQLPVIVNRENNIVTEIEIDNTSAEAVELSELFFSFKHDKNTFTPKAVRVFYLGTMSGLKNRTSSWVLNDEFKRMGGSQQIFCNPSYSLLKDEKTKIREEFSLRPAQKLVPGKNYFIICLEVKKFKGLSSTFTLNVTGYKINNKITSVKQVESTRHRLAIGLKNHGDDGVYAFRIPGLVTSKKGTLLAVYDIRHNTSLDLQENIDIGLSRSLNGGKTWKRTQVIMDMGEYGGLPEAQNGVGDPCILSDDITGDIYVFAIWTHGLGNNIAWNSSGNGMKPLETAQMMYVKSSDDGVSWSNPVNITEQVKEPSWRFLLQGPGRGITMQNGTLVVPIQYIDSAKIPNAGIMYSTDRGKTWKASNYAQTNTTEAQVAELTTGELMLNMRDNRGGFRSIFTTTDMGNTWKEHPTSRKALQEPVCMASLLNVRKEENESGKDILLFSNPNQSKRPVRSNMTIKASLNQGESWTEKNQLLLDEEWGWGYSCMTMIDRATIGILYEGSTSQLIFQTIKIEEIINQK